MFRISAIAGLSASLMGIAAPSFADGDYVCKASLFGKTARLWLENDTPVKYKWSNRPEYAASMSGSTITIQASPNATLSNVNMGKTSNGKKALQGDWKFKDNIQNGVVFVCDPA